MCSARGRVCRGTAVRKSDDFLGLELNLRRSIERDILIRNAARANASIDVSVLAATRIAGQDDVS